MADIRELLILNPRILASARDGALLQLFGNLRMVLRRFVLRTGRVGVFRSFYLAVYRLHVWVARTLVLRFKGTRAIYLSAGMGRGEIRPGISDIDLVIFGDWPEKVQFRLLKSLAVVVLLMPLFDRESLGAIQTWEDFTRINATDLFLAYHYASAKRNWKLLWGEDLIHQLPNLALERRAGAAHLEMRRWWAVFIKMAIGQNVTSRDRVFHNSLSFKAAADMLRAEVMMRGEVPPRNRTEILRQHLHDADAPLRDRLLASEATSFLQMEGDPRELLTHWLLRRMERTHTTLSDTPSFGSVAIPVLEGVADERLITPAVAQQAERLAERAAGLSGFRAAYLLPCSLFLSPDNLGLFFEFDAAQLPSADQLRDLMDEHFGVVTGLPQRLAVYLLLEHGAYILDPVYGLEIWSWALVPQANPDVFVLFSRPEFVLRGTARPTVTDIRWSRVSQELLEEELLVRRGAYARFGVLSRPTAAENLRNLFRFLQLLVMEQRSAAGEVTIPVSIAAIGRTFAKLAPELASEIQRLEYAMSDVLDGRPVHVDEAVQRIYDWTRDHGLASSPRTPAEEVAAGM